MHKIELEQGSEEWLNWRKQLLTATDAPMLMGASPYVTPYQGWQRKLGLIPEQKSNSAMERGKRDEPIARSMFVDAYGIDMQPCCVESSQYHFIGASLDGISQCGKYILEVKSNGIQYHDFLDSRGIPDFHMMQMQHQLLAANAEKCFYCSYNNGNIIVKEVPIDLDWIALYLPKAKEFWKGVVLFEPPPLTSKDYKDMTAMPIWNSYATEYRNICTQIKMLEDLKDSYKKEIVSLCDEESCTGSGIKVQKRISKGRIDYDAIPEIQNMDLDKYRKKSTCTWTIMLD